MLPTVVPTCTTECCLLDRTSKQNVLNSALFFAYQRTTNIGTNVVLNLLATVSTNVHGTNVGTVLSTVPTLVPLVGNVGTHVGTMSWTGIVMITCSRRGGAQRQRQARHMHIAYVG